MAAGAAALGIKLGDLGYRQAGLVADLGRQFGTSVCVGYHGESHIGCIIAAHFANGVLGGSELPCEASFFLEIAADLSDPPLEFTDGHLALSERPGYGVDLNPALVKRFAA
jgi:L-alanine-DL-glutamate epimerase-like enolase superfamily enzyme